MNFSNLGSSLPVCYTLSPNPRPGHSRYCVNRTAECSRAKSLPFAVSTLRLLHVSGNPGVRLLCGSCGAGAKENAADALLPALSRLEFVLGEPGAALNALAKGSTIASEAFSMIRKVTPFAPRRRK